MKALLKEKMKNVCHRNSRKNWKIYRKAIDKKFILHNGIQKVRSFIFRHLSAREMNEAIDMKTLPKQT